MRHHSGERRQWKGKSCVYVTPAGAQDAKIDHFINETCVIMLPSVSAIGDTAPPLFVFKGCQLPYRQVIISGRSLVETYADHLLPRSFFVRVGAEEGWKQQMFSVWCAIRATFATFSIRWSQGIAHNVWLSFTYGTSGS